jgi:hypothetical protein
MGGAKGKKIKSHPLLDWQSKMFGHYLQRGDSRLMIIGYGFLDEHIYDQITKSVRHHGLKIFNVSPEGSDHARVACDRNRQAAKELPDVFRLGLIGASRRPLSDTFAGDSIELNKILRYFDK